METSTTLPISEFVLSTVDASHYTTCVFVPRHCRAPRFHRCPAWVGRSPWPAHDRNVGKLSKSPHLSTNPPGAEVSGMKLKIDAGNSLKLSSFKWNNYKLLSETGSYVLTCKTSNVSICQDSLPKTYLVRKCPLL